MAYCTLDDLKDKISEDILVELTDDDGAGIIDTSRTDRAMADAESEIDSYCAARYKIPLDPVPGIVRKYCVDIAVYNRVAQRAHPELFNFELGFFSVNRSFVQFLQQLHLQLSKLMHSFVEQRADRNDGQPYFVE